MFPHNEKAYISQSSLDTVELDSSFDLEAIPILATPDAHQIRDRSKLWFKTHLVPRVLAADRQSQGMSPATVSTGIPQSLDIIQHLSAEVVLDLHFR